MLRETIWEGCVDRVRLSGGILASNVLYFGGGKHCGVIVLVCRDMYIAVCESKLSNALFCCDRIPHVPYDLVCESG
jgi:hypothetical protein